MLDSLSNRTATEPILRQILQSQTAPVSHTLHDKKLAHLFACDSGVSLSKYDFSRLKQWLNYIYIIDEINPQGG
jgi:hypothetical protein